MVPALDFLGAGGQVLQSLGESAGTPIMSTTYHFKPTIGKGKRARPNPDAQAFPDGVRLVLPQGLAIFLVTVGGVAALFLFWDSIINYLDKKGWRDKNNTMWNNLMGLGILGGMQDAVGKAGGSINKASGDFQKAMGDFGAKIQGK